MRTILLFLALGLANLAVAAEPIGSASEPPPYAQSFRDLDINRDGQLSFSEAFPNPLLSNAFNQIDQNADGFLTPAEIAAVFSAR
ncbi:MAG TPA: hypothetical protein VFC18_19415 [Burkholderiales bacterium]|nr:hypothetical protein [Burkholderiales bacterium]